MEDERTFSTLSFMKSKLQNQLARHLNIACVCLLRTFTLRKLFLSTNYYTLKWWKQDHGWSECLNIGFKVWSLDARLKDVCVSAFSISILTSLVVVQVFCVAMGKVFVTKVQTPLKVFKVRSL